MNEELFNIKGTAKVVFCIMGLFKDVGEKIELKGIKESKVKFYEKFMDITSMDKVKETSTVKQIQQEKIDIPLEAEIEPVSNETPKVDNVSIKTEPVVKSASKAIKKPIKRGDTDV